MRMPDRDDSILHSKVLFRSIHPDDKEVMMRLHKEFFPVPYSETFFTDMVLGLGVNKGELFTAIAEEIDSKEVIGFVLAQVFDYPSQCEDKDMFGYPEPSKACYILTLGAVERYRRMGLASALIARCIAYSAAIDGCGGVYLHVIHYNHSAIKFYEHNGFEMVRYLPDFYFFDQRYFSAYLYVYYLEGYQPTLLYRLFDGFRKTAFNGVDLLGRFVSMLSLWGEERASEDVNVAAVPRRMKCDGDVCVLDDKV